jgi:hypothetical protein
MMNEVLYFDLRVSFISKLPKNIVSLGGEK